MAGVRETARPTCVAVCRRIPIAALALCLSNDYLEQLRRRLDDVGRRVGLELGTAAGAPRHRATVYAGRCRHLQVDGRIADHQCLGGGDAVELEEAKHDVGMWLRAVNVLSAHERGKQSTDIE